MLSKTNKMLFLTLILLLGGQKTFAFDWSKVIESLSNDEKFLSCSKQGNVNLFTLTQGFSDDIWLDMPTKANISLSQDDFQNYNFANMSLELWNPKDKEWEIIKFGKVISSNAASGNLKLAFAEEGFYRISYVEVDKKVLYAVIADGISKSLRKYLTEIKKGIEKNPDPQLYKSSILISKINDLLRDKETKLSQGYAQKLSRIVQEYHGLKEGKCPELTPGLYKFRLKRFPGATVMEYILRVPESYDPAVSSLFVYYTDTSGSHRVGNYSNFKKYITLWSHTVTYKDYYWEDFEYVFDIICRKLNIDVRKTHIVGGCGNGIGAMGTAMRHPDFWAGCYVSLGNSKRELSRNAYNMHMRFSHHNSHRGNPDKDGWFTFMAKCLEYNRCPDIDCEIQEVADSQDCIKSDIIRTDSPAYIQYRTDSLKRGKAYWLSIDSRKDENLYADIKAKVIDSDIYIEINNVESYSIWLNKAPVEGTEISIIETETLPESLDDEFKDNNILRKYVCDRSSRTVELTDSAKVVSEITEQDVFKRYPGRYANSNYLKSPLIGGGINDAFTQAYVVICPHIGIGDEKSVYGQFALRLAGGAPCFADFDSASESFETHNIIFVGSFEDFMALPAKVRSEVPFKMTENTVTATGRVCSGDLGVFSIYPNPLNTQKYLVTFVSNSEKSAAKMSHAFMGIKELPEFDLGVFSISTKRQFDWLIAVKLDATWDYHSGYSDILANVEKTQEWRWKAWRAEVIRMQIGADAGLFENCFNKPGNVPEGVVAKRDIHRYFHNTWLVKIEINGKELKKILTVPFEGLSKRKVVPEISGISFAKVKKAGQLYIGDIKDEKTYTLACPQKCLNGARVGLCPKEYKIIDDGFAIEFILKYLAGNQEINIDKELAEQKFRIF